MAKNNKKQKKELDEISSPENKIKISIISILIFVFGLISLLSLFSLSGSFGNFLDKILSWGFGWGKWFFPVLLIILSIALYRGKKFFSKKVNYIGLSLVFIFAVSLLHFFFKTSVVAKAKALEGLGGGYLGFYLSLFFKNIFGFWGGLIIVLAILFIAIILLFNITLSHLIGSKSFIFKTLNSFSNSLKGNTILLSADEKVADDNGEDEVAYEGALENEDLNNQDWSEDEEDILFIKKEIGQRNKTQNQLNEKSLSPVKNKNKEKKVNWKTKKIKIDLPVGLLSGKINKATSGDINNNILIIQRTLENFGILVEMGEVNVGPTVTQYTFKPSEGVKVSRITALSNDLSLALAAHPIRIEAPIPGKALVGIEVPNRTKAIVGLREMLEDRDFKNRSNNLIAALGKDVSGKNIFYDIAKMPHLLVAGATNSGKSVCLNTIIIGLLYQNSPDDLRFIMVDPKRVELPAYNGIPHLLTPVITEVSKTINALRWCLNEMDRRYELLNQASKKNIQTYNKSSKEKLPYIIFVIDELADLMVTASRDIEGSVIRLTQMSRAVGIHLILATQRPSVDVITGLIKANTPTRIAFSVASAVDSKTIIDSSGAEKLLGKGDMLFSTAELSKPKRIQGAYVGDDEILAITNYIKEKYGSADYLEGIIERQKVSGIGGVGLDGIKGDEDELLEDAKEIVLAAGKASTSLLQRRLRIGYSRAASILDMLEEAGMVGPSDGSRPREILISKEQYKNESNNSMASVPVHSKKDSKAPDNYLYQEDESPLVLDDSEEEDDDENQKELEKDLSKDLEESLEEDSEEDSEEEIEESLEEDSEEEIEEEAEEDLKEDVKDNNEDNINSNSKNKKRDQLGQTIKDDLADDFGKYSSK